MILLFVTYGLGNRMRTLASALELSKITGHSIRIFWPITEDYNAAFEDVFIKDDDLNLFNIHVGNNRQSLLAHIFQYSHEFRWASVLMINGNFILSHSEKELIDQVSKHRFVIIRTCFELLSSYPLSVLKFNENVKENSIVSRYNSLPLIGIHIRRSDNIWATENSQSSLFDDRIDLEIQNNSQVKFYLATDDKQEKQRLVEKYTGYFIVQPIRSFDRNSTEGIIDAAIEFYNLSCCTCLYGSFASTFSELAARYSKIPIVILSDEEARPSRIQWINSYQGKLEPDLNFKEKVSYSIKSLYLLIKSVFVS